MTAETCKILVSHNLGCDCRTVADAYTKRITAEVLET